MPLAIPIVVLLALLVSMGMASAQRPISGGFISWAARAFRNLPLLGGFSIDQIVKMDRYITHQLGRFFGAVEGAGVRWFADLGHYVQVMGYWTTEWASALAQEVKHLKLVTIPGMIRAHTGPIARQARAAAAQAKAAQGTAHTVPKVAKAHDRIKQVTTIERVAMPHAREWEWINRHWKALTSAVVGTAAATVGIAVPGSFGWTNPLDALRRAHGKRLARIEKLLGVAGFAVLLARTLGLGSARCLRGGNLAKAARRICGLDARLFDSLLLDLVAVLSVVSVVEFASDLRAIEDEALTVASKMIREWPS